jgi:hypothetical protein
MILEWIRIHEAAFWWIGTLSLATFVGTLIIIPILVIRIPVDYFRCERQKSSRSHKQFSFMHILLVALKNLVGFIFLLAGFAMLLFPGQGLITILIGIMMLNFPGKFALELRIVRQPTVLRAINWMRIKANRSALEVCRSPQLEERNEEKRKWI